MSVIIFNSKFADSSISDVRAFRVLTPFAANEIINLDTGVGNVGGTTTLYGIDVDLGDSVAEFNVDPRINIEVNNVLRIKGVDVHYVNKDAMYFNFAMAAGSIIKITYKGGPLSKGADEIQLTVADVAHWPDPLNPPSDLEEAVNLLAARTIAGSEDLSSHLITYKHSNIPTDNIKDASAGTSGTPSDSNRFVTDLDYRLSKSRDIALVINLTGNTIPSGKLVKVVGTSSGMPSIAIVNGLDDDAIGVTVESVADGSTTNVVRRGMVNFQAPITGAALSKVYFDTNGDPTTFATDRPIGILMSLNSDVVYVNIGQGGASSNTESIVADVTRTIYVDPERTDGYAPNGSMMKPFKTLLDAINASESGDVINLAPGVYTGSIAVPNNVSIHGSGIGKSILQGSVTTGNGYAIFSNFTIQSTFLLNGEVLLNNIKSDSDVISAGTVRGYNVSIENVTSVPLTVSGVDCQLFSGTITTSGDRNSITHTSGTLNINNLKVNGSSNTEYVLNSTGGYLFVGSSFIQNSLAGGSVNISNNSTNIAPNMLLDIFVKGNINCGTSPTIVNGKWGTGAISGDTLIFKSTDEIANNSNGVGDTLTEVINDIINSISPAVTTTLYVDKGRTENYTPDGSNLRPYKDISSALTAASNNTLLVLSSDEYEETFTISKTVKLKGTSFTKITGDISVNANCSFSDLEFNGDVTINSDAALQNCTTRESFNVTSSANVMAYNVKFAPTLTLKKPLNMTTTGRFYAAMSEFKSTGDVSAITQSSGVLVLDSCTLVSDSTNATLKSAGGISRITNGSVTNNGSGESIDCDNGALQITPNYVRDVICNKAITFGTSYTFITGLNNPNIIGTNPIYEPASTLKNDSSLSGTTIKDALDWISTNIYTGNQVEQNIQEYIDRNVSDGNLTINRGSSGEVQSMSITTVSGLNKTITINRNASGDVTSIRTEIPDLSVDITETINRDSNGDVSGVSI